MKRFGGIVWLSLVLLAVANAGWWLWLQTTPIHTAPANFAFNALYGIPYFAAGAFMLVRLWKWRNEACPDGLAMVLVAISCLAYGIGQWAWTYANFWLAIELPSPSFPDLLYAVSSTLTVIAFAYLLVHRHRAEPMSSVRAAMSILAACAVSAISSVVVLYAFYAGDSGYFALDQFYIGTAFVSAFTTLICIQRERHGDLRRFLGVILLAVLLNMIGSILYGLRVAFDTYWNGDIADGVFLLSGLAYLLSVTQLPERLSVHPAREREGTHERLELFVSGSIAIFGLCLAIVGAELIYDSGSSDARRQLRSELLQTTNEIQLSGLHAMTQLSALTGFFEGSEVVRPDEFYAFVLALEAGGGPKTYIGFVDERGDALLESAVGAFPASFRGEIEALVRDAREHGDVAVSEPLAHPFGEAVVLMARPAYRNGEAFGYPIVSIGLSSLLAGAREVVGSNGPSFEILSDSYVFSLPGDRLVERSSGNVVFGSDLPALSEGNDAVFEIDLPSTKASFAGKYWVVRVRAGGRLFDTYVISLGFFFGILFFFTLFSGVIYLILGQRNQLRIQLERKTRILNQFVSLVAHQLRAPMTQLRWTTEHLASHRRLPKDVRELASRIDRIAATESRLVGDLLNVSRIDRGVLKIDRAVVPVSVLTREAVEPFSARAVEAGIEVRAEAARNRQQVLVDRQKAVEAIRNVLDNALKFSPAGGVVRVFVYDVTDTHVGLAIQDQGPGIPPAARDNLFDIKLGPDAATPEFGSGPTSTGLGLYLTKHFVQAMGGKVSVETGSKGTTFCVWLPKASGRRVASAKSKR